jgi:hypothetical protein
MLRRTGSSVGMGISARPGPAEVVFLARRPWEPAGRVAVDALVVWALRDQRAGRDPVAGMYRAEAEADGYAWRGSSSDGVAAVGRIGEVGCRIDVSGGGRAVVHLAADAVEVAIRSLEAAALVVDYGQAGAAPSGWEAPDAWFMPSEWEAGGEAMWVYAERRQGAHCPIVQVSSEDGVELARGEYRRWWDALEQLAWLLSARALGFVVMGPSVPREPWNTPRNRLDGGGLV